MARQVSHPNVCRVYDVGEFEGHTFLSMEYVDGEDLASLLRRIGRFPQDRADRARAADLRRARRRARPRRRPSRSEAGEHHARRQRQDPDHRLRPRRRDRRSRCAPARPPTWRPSSSPAARSRRAATSTRSAWSSTSCSPGSRALDAANMAELIAKREQGDITLADRHRPRSRPGHRARHHALPRAGSGAAAGIRARRRRRRCRAAIRSRRRSRPAKRRRPTWSPPPGPTGTVAMSTAVAPVAAWIVVGCAIVLVALSARADDQRRAAAEAAGGARGSRAGDRRRSSATATTSARRRRASRTSLDWARYIARTTTEPRPLEQAADDAARDLRVLVSHQPARASARSATTNPIEAINPPLNIARHDARRRGRRRAGSPSSSAVPSATQPTPRAAPKMNWSVLFEAAGLPMAAFTPVPPRWRPPVYADERDGVGRAAARTCPSAASAIEAAATGGRPVFFAITGPVVAVDRATATLPPTPLARSASPRASRRS